MCPFFDISPGGGDLGVCRLGENLVCVSVFTSMDT